MRKRGLFRMVSLFLLSLFLMAGCGGGGGGGGGGSSETPSGYIAGHPQVARNPNGQAIVAYQRRKENVEELGFKLYANYYNGQNWLGPLEIVSKEGTICDDDYKVAISSNGRAIVVWLEKGESNSLWAKIYKNGWLDNVPIGNNVWNFSVAMDSNGNAVVVWSDTEQKNIIKRMYINNSWTNSETIYSSSGAVDSPHVAIDLNDQAHFVWSENEGYIGEGNIIPITKILYRKPSGDIKIVWQLNGNLSTFPPYTYLLRPTSLVATDDVIIGIHYTKIDYDQPPSFTLTLQAYASIGGNQPSPISNPVSTSSNNITSWIDGPEVVMDDSGNTIGVWEQLENNVQHVWFNTYTNSSWQDPTKITSVDTYPDYKDSSNPSVDFHKDGEAILVYARHSTTPSVGVYATIVNFSSNTFTQPQQISREPTLLLTGPMVSKGLVVWGDSKTPNAQLPNTIYGRFYNPLQDSWSDIIQIGD